MEELSVYLKMLLPLVRTYLHVLSTILSRYGEHLRRKKVSGRHTGCDTGDGLGVLSLRRFSVVRRSFRWTPSRVLRALSYYL